MKETIHQGLIVTTSIDLNQSSTEALIELRDLIEKELEIRSQNEMKEQFEGGLQHGE